MQMILPRLYTFTGLLVGRVYCREDPDGLTLIDTGATLAAGKILRQVEAAGHQPQDIKRILITHAHPDHAGGLPKLKAATGAQVIASEGERAALQGEIPIPRRATGLHPPPTRLKPTHVDRIVGDGDALPEVFDGLRVLFTPGHTPGHLSFWQPEMSLLFCGDAIFNMLGLTLPLALLTVDMDENKRSIKRLVELEPQIVCFGHGRPLTQQTSERLRAFAHRVGAI